MLNSESVSPSATACANSGRSPAGCVSARSTNAARPMWRCRTAAPAKAPSLRTRSLDRPPLLPAPTSAIRDARQLAVRHGGDEELVRPGAEFPRRERAGDLPAGGGVRRPRTAARPSPSNQGTITTSLSMAASGALEHAMADDFVTGIAAIIPDAACPAQPRRYNEDSQSDCQGHRHEQASAFRVGRHGLCCARDDVVGGVGAPERRARTGAQKTATRVPS